MLTPCTRKHALVTGASSGIGRATALRLARDGYHVFATVRRSSDGKAVEQSAHGLVTPLVMDVAKPDEIAAAAEALAGHVGDRGLDLLVNNAGVGVFLPMELVSMERFRHQLDVNVTGQVAVTQAFLPMIRQATGRILMMGSVADRITMPFAGPQAAAKSALAALTEAFRLELAPWGIRVVLVEPASIRSDAIGKLERDSTVALDGFGAVGRGRYATSFRTAVERALEREEGGSDPDVVAGTVVRAARSRHPRARYLTGRHSSLLAAAATFPPVVLDPIRRRIFGLPKPGSAETARDSR